MALYTWDPCLESGYALIDNQHKLLLTTLNEMWEAYHEGLGVEKLEKGLDFLMGYSVKHFSDEEKLQVAYKYPDYIQHKQIHNEFKKTVTQMVERFQTEGISDALVDEVCLFMGNWFVTHIQGEDFALVAYIKLQDCAE